MTRWQVGIVIAAFIMSWGALSMLERIRRELKGIRSLLSDIKRSQEERASVQRYIADLDEEL
jgi:hypothetical protein